MLKSGYLPLICPPALSDEGEAINVDGDRAAGRIAAAMGAEKLIILANVPGLLRDENDESTLIEEIDRRNLGGFEGFAKGRMKKKLMGAGEALERGVKEVMLADARVDHPLAAALRNRGTRIH